MRAPDLSIIEKTLNNEATPEESREVVRWFKTPEGQAWLAERIDQDEKAIQAGEEEEWIDHPIPSAVMYQRITRQLRRQRIRRLVAYAAAVLIPVALLIGLFMRVDSQVDLLADAGYDEVYVPKGERMQVLFQDGSKVHLNSGSRIRYPKKFGLSERKVYLEGEAWFEVAKNKSRPFIVDLSCMDVKVLGTTFDVKAYPEDPSIWVALETGSIEISSGAFASYQLKPGDKAVYDRATRRCEVSHSRNARAYSAWKRNVLVFKNAPLSEVLKTLERTYDQPFEVKDPAALEYTYTLTTDRTRLDVVLGELEKITPVSFVRSGDQIEVRMRPVHN